MSPVALTPLPRHSDSYAEVYEAACPRCELPLTWAYETPPIPMTFFSWFADEGCRVDECPRCWEPLPTGDLRASSEASTPDLLDPEGSGYVREPPWDIVARGRPFVVVGYGLAAAFALLGIVAWSMRPTLLCLGCACSLAWAARETRR